VLALACASSPSPRWQHGGAALAKGTAYWSREDSTVELRPSGEVFVEDELVFRFDGAGRISDAQGERVAVLMPDGYLIAEDDDEDKLAWVGAGASFVGTEHEPGVYVFPTGQVFLADADGEWFGGGYWVHCDGPLFWTCTLVTHVISARDRAQGKGSSSGSGAGDVLKLLEVLRIFAH
jgi:hypothetical protein